MEKITAGEEKVYTPRKKNKNETRRGPNFIGIIRQEVRRSEAINVNSLFLNHLVVLAKFLEGAWISH